MVVVGSPRVLLKTEQHMVKLYGDKGRCWSFYLKSCIEHGTLTIPSLVEADKSAKENFIAELAANVGATLPSDRKSSRANYRTRGTISNVASSERVIHGSREGMHSSQSTANQQSSQAKSRIRLVDKRLSSDENVFKQMSQVASMDTQVTSSDYSQSAIQMQRPMGPIQKLKATTSPEVNRTLSSNLAANEGIQENMLYFNDAPSSKRTISAKLSRPIKSTSSQPLSKPMHGQNIEAHKSRSRGIL